MPQLGSVTADTEAYYEFGVRREVLAGQTSQGPDKADGDAMDVDAKPATTIPSSLPVQVIILVISNTGSSKSNTLVQMAWSVCVLFRSSSL